MTEQTEQTEQERLERAARAAFLAFRRDDWGAPDWAERSPEMNEAWHQVAAAVLRIADAEHAEEIRALREALQWIDANGHGGLACSVCRQVRARARAALASATPEQ